MAALALFCVVLGHRQHPIWLIERSMLGMFVQMHAMPINTEDTPLAHCCVPGYTEHSSVP